MRTTLDLPAQLISEAMKLSHQKTKTALIISALEDFVRKARISGIKKYKGKVNLDIDLNELRQRT
ncbi:MAG: type II toxin-antitoxin system VapB family antitoxin [Thermoplasmata archaeon]|nr:MAG: type II toxin-antitoxin system VapB family antitoxin [Thermoplasmata archaeon]